MVSSTFKNVVAITLNMIGLSLSIVRVLIVLWLTSKPPGSSQTDVRIPFFCCDLVYAATFVLALSKPDFLVRNKIVWAGFLSVLLSDFMINGVVLAFSVQYVHQFYQIGYYIQLGFNFVVMVGSFFGSDFFVLQSKAGEISLPDASA